MTEDLMPRWTRQCRRGDFAAIPAPFTWEQSAALARLLDGYDLMGGATRVSDLAHRVMRNIINGEGHSVPALDLWVTLFYQQRAHRHSGYPLGFAEKVILDGLCEALRKALLKLTPAQRAGILGALGAGFPCN